MRAFRMSLRDSVTGLVIAGFLVFTASGFAVDYLHDIKPVLKERCYSCHGSLKQKSDLRVDTAAAMIKATVVSPGSIEKSELLARVSSPDDDERMPPEGHALTAAQIASIREWIRAGAPHPEDEMAEDDPANHWSFQPVRKPPVPEIAGVSHPVDAFLAAKQREQGLVAQKLPERTLLLRRLHLDLTGLPPTVEQLNDERSWEKIVDELLASPHHGERWARHWMDVWRYSDWYGLGAQLRYSQKHLWHWRDWIVESLNEDKGYDEMICEMLAGDELAPGDPKTLRATGFLARNYFLFNRTTWLDNTIEHTGKAFLGLTLNCAKCHDHKYDPIDVEDYYSFRAIFEPHQVRLDPVPGVTDFEKNGLPRVFDDQPDAETFIHLRGDPKQPDKNTEISAAVPAFLSKFAPQVEPVKLPLSAYAPGAQAFVQKDRLASATEKVKRAEEALSKARKAIPKPDPASPGEAKKLPPESKEAFVLEDDFKAPDPELWELRGSGLEYRNGVLEQTVGSREPGQLITRAALPRNFEVTCRYTTTGGPTYKSVTFRFDLTGDGNNANFVYTSEHAPGPKVQAAYTRNGNTAYPSDGRSTKSEAVGRPQELRFAVRDQLVNVWLDGKFVLAYAFPDRIDGGRFSLSAFDATARFSFIRIESLRDDLKLTEAKNATDAVSPDSLEKAVRQAELDLAAAIAEEKSTRATIAADLAQFAEGKTPDGDPAMNAARLQVEAMKARAESDVLRHEGGDAKKLKAAKALQKRAAEKAAELKKGTLVYEPLRGSRKALETPAHKEEDYPAVYSRVSTGRRTMLAKWMTSPENPLTARVAVNHVWMRHFGEPLVESVFEFGRQARQPLHSELLDYLAAEFMESGWSFRHLHRLLVTSQTYQRSSSTAGADRETLAADPENLFYWRASPKRMESQVVRDSLLHLAGQIDLTVGGPSLDSKAAGNRRSLYFTHSPDKLDPFLTTFDDADLLQCYRRSESVVPQQALALSNSALALQSAKKIAEQIDDEQDSKSFTEAAFREILARNPTASEIAECLLFFDDLSALSGKSGGPEKSRARAQLVHALLNHNDFVTIR